VDGTVDVPKIGKVKKGYVYGGAAALGAFVLYRYWAARDTGDEESVPTDPAFGDGEVLPVVPGAYTPGGGGIADDSTTPAKDAPPATNDEWSRRAATELAGQGGMDYGAVVDALGAYLARKPLTTAQASLVQAAIAVMGYPPSGSYQVIPATSGGDTPITVAPASVTARQSADAQTIAVSWAAVPGAASYHVFRSDQAGPTVASGTSLVLYHIEAGYTIKISVAAVSSSGKVGPKSAVVSVKTVGPKLTAPARVTAKALNSSTIEVSWTRVPNAELYRVYVGGLARGTSENPPLKIGSLKSKTTYKVEVKADAEKVSPGPGRSVSVKTK